MIRIDCRDCKHLVGTLYCEEYIKDKGISKGAAVEEDVTIRYINHFGDCQFYSRKWWKFWR